MATTKDSDKTVSQDFERSLVDDFMAKDPALLSFENGARHIGG